MPPRAKKASAAKKPGPKTKKATPKSKKGAASISVEENNLSEPEVPSPSVDEKNISEPEDQLYTISEEKTVIKEESTVVYESVIVEEASLPSAAAALEPHPKEESAVVEETVAVKEAVLPSAGAALEAHPKEEVPTTVEELEVSESEEAVDNGKDDDVYEEPEEIEGDETEGSTPMDTEEGVEQEIVEEEETGVDEIEDAEGSEDDNAGSNEDDDESGSDDEEDDEGTEEDEEEAGVDEVEDAERGEQDNADTNGDADDSGSDDEEDDEGTEEEDDPSVYMHAPLTDRKKGDFEIFVGGLDKEAVEDDLTEVFTQFGEIQAVRIVKHPTTQKSKGFAFVRYATTEQAKKALDELKDGTEVKGKLVRVSASLDNDTLYMGNICKTWTKDHVLATLKGYGIEQIEEICLPDDPKKEGKSKGFAFLEFSTHSDAMAAFQRLRKPDAVLGRDRSAKVAFAQSLHPREEALLQVKTVFIECLPASWDEDKVEEHCKQYGEIEKVQLPRKSTTKKRKDFGFVEFASRESAVTCVEGINNAQLGEGETKVKANIAKPQNKGRLAKLGIRGGFKVKKDGGNAEEASLPKAKGNANPSKVKGNAKAKTIEQKGKAHVNLKGSEASKPSKSKPVEGQGGGPSQGRQKKEQDSKVQGAGPSRGSLKKEQQSKGVKRGGRGMESTRPSKRARDNRNIGNARGRPVHNFGNRKNFRFGKPKANQYMRRAAYSDAYAPRYGVHATSYQDRAYGAAAGSRHYYSDMEPHAGYMEPTADMVRDPYAYGPRSSGGYDSHGRIGAGYIGGPLPPSSYVHQYPSYAGYEAGYGYPSTAAYPPRRSYY
ncbi:uncharacterized protein LOC131232267 isoform X2 [Magnolia sinica]|uniref:uncharacterized protein LOC131232267 isoform X2 n=1 Tax=Magnolia sinica TaxID=86752 RepID=UPI00265A44DF|nr:uncharacterized protein LOC131232267 isoform X2 [Magnolia sinica]